MKKKYFAEALFWWIVCGFGLLGFHRFYLGRIFTGIIWVMTLGLLGFGAAIDLFCLGEMVDKYNSRFLLKEVRSVDIHYEEHL